MKEEDVQAEHIAAYLHDIGKIEIYFRKYESFFNLNFFRNKFESVMRQMLKLVIMLFENQTEQDLRCFYILNSLRISEISPFSKNHICIYTKFELQCLGMLLTQKSEKSSVSQFSVLSSQFSVLSSQFSRRRIYRQQ